MKKALVLILITCIFFTTVSQRTYATEYSTNEMELQKQEEIESIFREINEIAVRKNHIKYLDSLKIHNYLEEESVDLVQIKIEENKRLLNVREDELNLELADLNVRKIDTDNKQDMAILSELSEVSVKSDTISLYASSIDTAPDLAALATAFSIYI